MEMDEGLPELRDSDDDVGPAAPYEPDSESDTDSDGEDVGAAEPPAKRPREIHALGVAGAIGVLPDEAAAETPLNELQRFMASAEVRRILDELEEGADFKLPANRSRQQPKAASQWSSECAEVYSPPRITSVASHMGLKTAWAMNLTTLDESGNPWDFSQAAQRKKALRRLREDKPLMLVACPMCGPFSSMNELNYARMSEQQIRTRLHDAMMHMRFALSLCIQQYNAGRLFLFEHPAGASSWGRE